MSRVVEDLQGDAFRAVQSQIAVVVAVARGNAELLERGVTRADVEVVAFRPKRSFLNVGVVVEVLAGVTVCVGRLRLVVQRCAGGYLVGAAGREDAGEESGEKDTRQNCHVIFPLIKVIKTMCCSQCNLAPGN